MKSINELTDQDSEALATMLKYDIPYAEGVKEELIECYNSDTEGLMLGKYMPINLFFQGLHWLSSQGYDLSGLIKNLGLEADLEFYPKEIQRLKTELDNANAKVSQLEGGELYSNEPEYFADWIGDKYVKMFGGWMPRYADQRMTENLITTEELYKLFLNSTPNGK